MAKHQTKTKMTRAEAGRLGGMTTKKRHGIEHYRAAGKKGGQAVKAKYGTAHLSQLGKKGFQGLRRRFGYAGGSGRGALIWLERTGKLPRETPDQAAREQAAFEELIDRILDSVRS